MPQNNRPSIQQMVRQELDRTEALIDRNAQVHWASVLQERLDAEAAAGRAANAPAETRRITILGIFREFYEELHGYLDHLQSN